MVTLILSFIFVNFSHHELQNQKEHLFKLCIIPSVLCLLKTDKSALFDCDTVSSASQFLICEKENIYMQGQKMEKW